MNVLFIIDVSFTYLFVYLKIEHRVLYMLGNYSTTELTSSLCFLSM